MKKHKKLPRDSNQRANEIFRLSTKEPEGMIQAEEQPPTQEKPSKESSKEERSVISQYLAEIGRKGGLKGGKARSERLTPEQRKEIAQKAAKTRWDKKKT